MGNTAVIIRDTGIDGRLPSSLIIPAKLPEYRESQPKIMVSSYYLRESVYSDHELFKTTYRTLKIL